MYYECNQSMYNFVTLLKQVSDIKIGRRVTSFIRLSTLTACMHEKAVKSSCILHLDNFIYLFTNVCITFLCRILFCMYVSNYVLICMCICVNSPKCV